MSRLTVWTWKPSNHNSWSSTSNVVMMWKSNDLNKCPFLTLLVVVEIKNE
jgi:hypothetical protein